MGQEINTGELDLSKNPWAQLHTTDPVTKKHYAHFVDKEFYEWLDSEDTSVDIMDMLAKYPKAVYVKELKAYQWCDTSREEQSELPIPI